MTTSISPLTLPKPARLGPHPQATVDTAFKRAAHDMSALKSQIGSQVTYNEATASSKAPGLVAGIFRAVKHVWAGSRGKNRHHIAVKVRDTQNVLNDLGPIETAAAKRLLSPQQKKRATKLVESLLTITKQAMRWGRQAELSSMALPQDYYPMTLKNATEDRFFTVLNSAESGSLGIFAPSMAKDAIPPARTTAFVAKIKSLMGKVHTDSKSADPKIVSKYLGNPSTDRQQAPYRVLPAVPMPSPQPPTCQIQPVSPKDPNATPQGKAAAKRLIKEAPRLYDMTTQYERQRHIAGHEVAALPNGPEKSAYQNQLNQLDKLSQTTNVDCYSEKLFVIGVTNEFYRWQPPPPPEQGDER